MHLYSHNENSVQTLTLPLHLWLAECEKHQHHQNPATTRLSRLLPTPFLIVLGCLPTSGFSVMATYAFFLTTCLQSPFLVPQLSRSLLGQQMTSVLFYNFDGMSLCIINNKIGHRFIPVTLKRGLISLVEPVRTWIGTAAERDLDDVILRRKHTAKTEKPALSNLPQ